MRVLHLISSGGMYGAEAVILNLSEAMSTNGAQGSAIGVFSHPAQPVPKLYEVARQRGIEAHLIVCRGQADVSVAATLRSLAERTRAEIIHAHGYKADIYAAIAWRNARPVLVSTCHTWYDNDLALRAYGAADRWVLRGFDGVVAVSEEVRARLLKAGTAADRIRLIRNGVNVQPFLEAGAERREGPELRVGLVGRLSPEKGIDVF
ncbi:MAG: glycosyltransferase family 4 protein, partial [Janthinobacterium lividum]